MGQPSRALADAERKLAAIDALHIRVTSSGSDGYVFCATCRHPWPCQTVEILRGAA